MMENKAYKAEDLESKSMGKYEIGVLILIMMGWLFDGAEIYIFGSTGSYIAKSLNYATALTGIIVATFNIGQLVSTYILSYVADRMGRRQAFIYSILIYSFASVLTGLSWNFISVSLFRFLTGVGTGVEWGLGATIASEIVPAKRRGLAVSIFNGGFPVGGFLAALVFKYIVSPNPISDWRYAYFLLFVPAILTLFFRNRYFKEPKRFQISKEAVATRGLKSAYGELFATAKMRFNTLLATLIAAPMRWNTLPWLGLLSVALTALKGFTPSLVAEYVLLNSITAMLGYYTGGTISDYLGRKGGWFFYFIFVVVGYLLTFVPPANDRTLIMLGGLLWGFGWGFSPIEVVMLAELFPTRARASGEGFALGIGLLGAVAMSLAWTKVVLQYGYYAGAVFLMWPLIIPPLAILLLYKETSKKPLEELHTISDEEKKIFEVNQTQREAA
ncbi:MAG TPA: MFS transporter [bacterium]|nr:MFS transporter [bacterium]